MWQANIAHTLQICPFLTSACVKSISAPSAHCAHLCVQVPTTSSRKSDGLYAQKRAQQALASRARVEARRAELEVLRTADATHGGPPSFYERDREAMAARAARLKAHRADKNRFQVCL